MNKRNCNGRSGEKEPGAGDIIMLRVPNSLEGCDGWGEGRGILYLTSVPYSLAEEYEAAKLRWVEGAQRPVWHGNAPKKTGVRSARARTRGKNPLVSNIDFYIFKTDQAQIYNVARRTAYLLFPEYCL